MDERKLLSPIRTSATGAPATPRAVLRLAQAPLAEPARPSPGYQKARSVIAARAGSSSLFELMEMFPAIFKGVEAVGLMTDDPRPGCSRYVRGFVEGSYVDAILSALDEADEALLKGTHQTTVTLRPKPGMFASMMVFSRGLPLLRNGPADGQEAADETWLVLAHAGDLFSEVLGSRIGALTMLPNTAMFEAAVLAAETAFYTQREHFSLILADIDDLKYINHDRSYAAGDIVLAEVADRLRNTLAASGYKGSVIFRPGKSKFLHGRRKPEETAANPALKHDEFAILLPEPLESAVEMAERLRSAVVSGPVRLLPPLFGGTIAKCSFGVVHSSQVASADGHMWRWMLDACVRHLETAKARGGNTVVFSG